MVIDGPELLNITMATITPTIASSQMLSPPKSRAGLRRLSSQTSTKDDWSDGPITFVWMV